MRPLQRDRGSSGRRRSRRTSIATMSSVIASTWLMLADARASFSCFQHVREVARLGEIGASSAAAAPSPRELPTCSCVSELMSCCPCTSGMLPMPIARRGRSAGASGRRHHLGELREHVLLRRGGTFLPCSLRLLRHQPTERLLARRAILALRFGDSHSGSLEGSCSRPAGRSLPCSSSGWCPRRGRRRACRKTMRISIAAARALHRASLYASRITCGPNGLSSDSDRGIAQQDADALVERRELRPRSSGAASPPCR